MSYLVVSTEFGYSVFALISPMKPQSVGKAQKLEGR